MQNEITVFSILEAIDNLGSGLLFMSTRANPADQLHYETNHLSNVR